jgi:hypothetical protein
MAHFVGLDVPQRMTAICAVDKDGRRVWRGQCASAPEDIGVALRRHAGADAKMGIETGAHIRGVLKTFGLLPGAMRGLPFDRKVEVLLEGRSDVALIIKAHARRLAATARAGRGFRPARGAHPTVGSIRAVEGVNLAPTDEWRLSRTFLATAQQIMPFDPVP